MSILVVCPGCRKRYQVNEKFAGKAGRCPNCKFPITVPTKSEEVVIHAPENFKSGGRGTTGKLVLKPIDRAETKFNPLVAAGIVCIAIVFFAVAFTGGKIGLFQENIFVTIIGLLCISPLLTITAYSFLYDDELDPYKGKPLFIRAAICGLIYALLWAVFAYVSDTTLTGEVWNWVFIAPPFFAFGSIVAATTLDLDYANGFFHYSFYVLVTILLRWAAGMGWVWDIKP
jgi:hypothetical protein